MSSSTGKTLIFLTPALVAMTTSASAQTYGRYSDRMMGPYHGFWGMGWMAWLFWGLVIIGLILLIRWVHQMTVGSKPSDNPGQRAIEILKERYAKGEIDKTQFDRIKKDLEA